LRLSVRKLLVLTFLASGLAFAPPPPDLPNFHPVAPGIYRGAAPTEAGLERLKRMGVHTIVDLRISPREVKKERKEAESLGFQWVNLPMGSDPPTSRQVSRFLEIMDHASVDPVFVHCQHGADRTGCMVGIWRGTRDRWDFPRIWKEMRRYGFDPRWKRLTEAVRNRAHP
jgi:protein tyrosine/serine phosphatase